MLYIYRNAREYRAMSVDVSSVSAFIISYKIYIFPKQKIIDFKHSPW